MARRLRVILTVTLILVFSRSLGCFFGFGLRRSRSLGRVSDPALQRRASRSMARQSYLRSQAVVDVSPGEIFADVKKARLRQASCPIRQAVPHIQAMPSRAERLSRGDREG